MATGEDRLGYCFFPPVPCLYLMLHCILLTAFFPRAAKITLCPLTSN